MAENEEFIYLTIGLGSLLFLILALRCMCCCTKNCSGKHTFRRIGGKGFKKRVTRNGLAESSLGVVKDFPYFLNKQNLYIFWRKWNCAGGNEPKAVVIVCHGLNEHCGRYEHIINRMTEDGYTVFSLDHQGHGKSEGDRMFLENDAHDFVADVGQLMEIAEKEFPEKQMFIYGHSMGGLIATLSTLEFQSKLSGTFLSAPAYVSPDQAGPVLIKVLVMLSGWFPKLRVSGIDLATLCRNDAVVDCFANDPLRYPHFPTLRFQLALLRGIQEANRRFGEIKLPLKIIHGVADKVVEINGSENLFAQCSSEDKNFIKVEEAFHELHNEPEEMIKEGDNLYTNLIDFLDSHLKTTP